MLLIIVLMLGFASCGFDCPEYDKYRSELKLLRNKNKPSTRDSLQKAYIMRACPGKEGKRLIERMANDQMDRIRFEDILICAQARDKQKGVKKKAYNPLSINYEVKHYTDRNGHTITILDGVAAYHDPECAKCKSNKLKQ